MPVFPLVASRMILPGRNWPLRSPSRTIEYAARSFTEPPGLNHSALAQNSTFGKSAPIRSILSKGVLPMRSSRCWPMRAPGAVCWADIAGLFTDVTFFSVRSTRVQFVLGSLANRSAALHLAATARTEGCVRKGKRPRMVLPCHVQFDACRPVFDPDFWDPDFWDPDFWDPDFWDPDFWDPDFWDPDFWALQNAH